MLSFFIDSYCAISTRPGGTEGSCTLWNSACKADAFTTLRPRPHKKSVSLTRAVCKQATWRLVSESVSLLITTILQSMLCLGIEPSADDGILPSFTLSLHWSKLLLRPFYTWRAANMRKEVKRNFFKGLIIAVKWLGRWVTIPQLGISPAGLTARCITNSAHFRIKKTRRVPTFIL